MSAMLIVGRDFGFKATINQGGRFLQRIIINLVLNYFYHFYCLLAPQNHIERHFLLNWSAQRLYKSDDGLRPLTKQMECQPLDSVLKMPQFRNPYSSE